MQSNNSKCSQIHIVMGSYVSEFPKSEELLAVNRGNQTNCPWYRCVVCKSGLSKSKIGNRRALVHTPETLKIRHRKDGDSKEMSIDRSMFPIRPICSKFSIERVDPKPGVFRTVCGKPVHDLSYGITPFVKEYTVELRKDETRSSLSMKVKSREDRTLSSIGKAVFCECNKSLQEVKRTLFGNDLPVHFSRRGRANILNRSFNETVDIGKLETKDFYNIDIVSPFMEANFD